MEESVQTPLALGDRSPNNDPGYHSNATTGVEQVAGQNDFWWLTLASIYCFSFFTTKQAGTHRLEQVEHGWESAR